RRGRDWGVVADRRRGQAHRLGKVTHPGLTVRRGLEEAEQTQPRRVGECLEHPGQLLGIGPLDRFARQWRGDRLGLGKCSTHVRHPSSSSIDLPTWSYL